MEQQYFIPANAKRGNLIFNLFRPIDLGITIAGGILSFLLFFAIKGSSLMILLIKLSPFLIAVFLVLPVPNYHNMLVLMREVLNFFLNRRIYLWKGWCVTSESSEK